MQAAIGGEVAWHVEFDAAPSKILAHHWPDVLNYGDITAVDWSTVEPIDILTGGFPCQDVSLAGARKGLKDGTRSGLWSEFAKAIDILRPSLVVIENVRGLLSASTVEDINEADSDLEQSEGSVGERERGDRPVLNAFGRVLGDLAELGYDTEWVGLRAADAGAPHGRYRVFVLAYPTGLGWGEGRPESAGLEGRPDDELRSSAATAHAAHNGHERPGFAWAGRAGLAHDSEPVADPGSERRSESNQPAGFGAEGADGAGVVDERRARSGGTEWGAYEPATRRWESVTGRVAPAPTNPDGKNGQHRLAAEFVEWMMGLEPGHVTDPAIGLTRNEQLKALGNGVVPQQAELALRVLLGGAV